MKNVSTGDFYQGQRWVSESEPELGLSPCCKSTLGQRPSSSGQRATRQYAHNAPLAACGSGRRHGRAGDVSLVVQSSTERDGLISITAKAGGVRSLAKTELNDRITFSGR
jgi:hypothetical protein